MSNDHVRQDSGDELDTSPANTSRRRFLQSAAAAATVGAAPHLHAQTQPATATPPDATPAADARAPVPARPVMLNINGRDYALQLEPRVTLLDALREYAGLMGTKKGCDRGQCGACTVLANGRRINACLTLAVMHEGEAITTIEGPRAKRHAHADTARIHRARRVSVRLLHAGPVVFRHLRCSANSKPARQAP